MYKSFIYSFDIYSISFDIFCHISDAEETTQWLHPPVWQSASCEIFPSTGEKRDSMPSFLFSAVAFFFLTVCFVLFFSSMLQDSPDSNREQIVKLSVSTFFVVFTD